MGYVYGVLVCCMPRRWGGYEADLWVGDLICYRYLGTHHTMPSPSLVDAVGELLCSIQRVGVVPSACPAHPAEVLVVQIRLPWSGCHGWASRAALHVHNRQHDASW